MMKRINTYILNGKELTKKEDSKTAKLSQELEKMSGATGSKDRPLVKEMPATQGLL